MLNVILNKNEEENVKLGFPWVYNNEIYYNLCKTSSMMKQIKEKSENFLIGFANF